MNFTALDNKLAKSKCPNQLMLKSKSFYNWTAPRQARIKRHWCVAVVVVVGSRWQGRGRLLILELFTIPVSGYIIGAGLIASYICKYFMQVLDLLFLFPACTCLWNLVANFQRVSIKCLKSTLNFDCFSWVSVYNVNIHKKVSNLGHSTERIWN